MKKINSKKTEGGVKKNDLQCQAEEFSRRIAEKSFSECEDRYHSVLENSNDLVWVLDKKGSVTYINKKAEELGGYKNEELKGKDFSLGISKKDLPKVKDAVKRTFSGIPQKYEASVSGKDGNNIVLLVNAIPLSSGGKIIGVVNFGEDITEKKKIRSALEKNEQKYRALYESSSDAIMLLDEKGFFDCNQATLKMFGYKAVGDFCSKHPGQVSPPVQPDGTPSMELADKRIREAFKKGSILFEWVHRRENGKDFPASVLLVSFELEGRKVLQAIVRDITERKKAEEDLLKFKFGLDHSGDAVFITDIKGIITYTNSAFEKIYGYANKEAIGKTPRIIKSGLISPEGYKQFWDTLRRNQVMSGEIVNKKKDGTNVDIEGANSSIVDALGKIIGFLAIHRDITERKKIEKELSEKTRELEDKNKKLENSKNELNKALEYSNRTSQMMVGRELRMRELKQEIKILNDKLKGRGGKI